MLTRVALAGCPSAELESLQGEALQHEVQLAPVERGAALPVGAAALLEYTESGDLIAAGRAAGRAQQEMLLLLAKAIDCREAFRPGSSERVMAHAARFAEALDLGVDDRFTLERGALLRGIGKLNIPNDVLLKEGVLTYDEWVLLQQHTNIGADMVREMSSLGDIEAICRRYHECYDGDGYPDRIEGDEIPLLARIVRILDVYCAMTSPRHYRQTTATHEEAIAHLRDERGKHFDGALVDVFIEHGVGRTEPAAPEA